MLNLPFSLLAARAGLKRFATATDVLCPYLSTTGFVIRSWARANAHVLTSSIRAYIAGLRWVLDPNNRYEATSLLQDNLEISETIATECYTVASHAEASFMRDGRIDIDGFRNVLELRAAFRRKFVECISQSRALH